MIIAPPLPDPSPIGHGPVRTTLRATSLWDTEIQCLRQKVERMTTLDARILGPLEVRIDGKAATIHGKNARKLLAVLLDEANRPVPVEGIVRGVWEDELPERPVRAARNLVSDLRRDLRPFDDRLGITDGGEAYVLRIEPGELDLHRCRDRRRNAAVLRGSDPAAAAESLREALAEWRGPALSGVPGRMTEAIARRLDEDRLILLEERFDVELELGRGPEILPELRQTVAKHATRQRFAAQLMRALHASGRSVEAIEHFEDVRRRLADDLGLDPDPELRAVHTAILQADEPQAETDPIRAAPAPAVPSTLPPTTARFTGRDAQLAALDQALAASAGSAGSAVISGMGGVGKTALAVHWAHRVTAEFPDGRLYLNLRGFDPAAPEADPGPALGAALRALGVEPDRIPADIDEQTGLYRTVLADRKVLVVLDNVRDTRQARPLLPSSPGSFTVITSRDPLVGLVMGGARPIPLQALTGDESQQLLNSFGAAGADADSRAGRRVLRICGGLPLALSLVGAWVAARPHASLLTLAERLESTSNVLNVFSDKDTAIDLRTVFTCSYQELGTRAADTFRLLGLHPGPDLTAPAAASLTATEPGEAAEALRELADANLIEEHRPGRFTMHDLLRAYAAEQLEAGVPQAGRDTATLRMLDHYIHTASEADAHLSFYRDRLDLGEPGEDVRPEPIPDLKAATAWFAAEYQVLRGLVQLRSEDGEGELEPHPELDRGVWRLAWTLSEYMMDKKRGGDLLAAQSAALAAARRDRNPIGEVVSLGYLAAALMLNGDEAGARSRIERAMALAEGEGRPWAKGFVLGLLSRHAGDRGDDEGAVAHARAAAELFAESGDARWEYRALYAIGFHSVRAGDLETAREAFAKIQAGSTRHRIRAGELVASLGFGLIAHHEGDFDEAGARYLDVSTRFADLGLPMLAGFSRDLLGDARLAAGNTASARTEWEAAAREYAEAGSETEAAAVQRKALRSSEEVG